MRIGSFDAGMSSWIFALGLLALAVIVSGKPEEITISVLKDIRSELTFIPYTPEERLFVAKQAQNLFSVSSLIWVKNWPICLIPFLGAIKRSMSIERPRSTTMEKSFL
jgi:hypothetical protein